jgi:phospholipid-binding lipoprotein MlaA
MMVNISEPVIIANDVLQGRPKRAVHDTVRLVANSSVGLLGAIDVATSAGLPFESNDFGITLGRWGVGPGPYLFLPLLGPSTVRDAIGSGADVALNPLNFLSYRERTAVSLGVAVVGGFDTFSQSEGQLRTLTGEAADPYATLRSVYLQNRAAQVSGDETPALPALEDEPSAPDDSTAPSSPNGTAPPPAPEATPQPQPAPGGVGPQSHAEPDPNAPIITGRDWRYDALSRPARPEA